MLFLTVLDYLAPWECALEELKCTALGSGPPDVCIKFQLLVLCKLVSIITTVSVSLVFDTYETGC